MFQEKLAQVGVRDRFFATFARVARHLDPGAYTIPLLGSMDSQSSAFVHDWSERLDSQDSGGSHTGDWVQALCMGLGVRIRVV